MESLDSVNRDLRSTEILLGDAFESLYMDLAKRPLVKILYTGLVKRTELLLSDLLSRA